MEKITRRVKDLARCYGASVVGITTKENLEGGPPSKDLTYVLEKAKSAVSYAIPIKTFENVVTNCSWRVA